MGEKTNLEEIKLLLFWYDNNSIKADINKLLEMQDKLAIRSYTLAEELAEMKKEYNFAYFTRKIEFNKAKSHYINEKKKGVSASDTEANLDVEDIQEKEVEFESLGYKLENLLRQINKILQATQQRISYLKIELEKTKKQNTT